MNVPEVYARVFDASGHALTDEFRVSGGPVCASPVVAKVSGGGFRVAWAQRAAERTNGWDIFTRAFDGNWQALGGAVRVNTTTFGDQYAPRIASSSSGELIVWASLGQRLSYDEIMGQWISANSLVGSEFRINTTTVGRQFQPAVAASPGQRFVVGWASLGEGTGLDLFSQRYSLSNP